MNKLFLIPVAMGLLGAASAQDDCCAKKGTAIAASQMACCGQKMTADDQFMAEAKKMGANSAPIGKAKQDDCCGAGDMKMAKKADCKAGAGQFKVFVVGVGYKYFDCEMCAAKGRKNLAAKHSRVGPIQKVSGKIAAN